MITPGYGDVSRNMIQLKCSMRRATIAAVAIWMIIFIYLAISIFTLQSKEREDRNEPQKKTDPLVIKYEESRKKIISLYENIDELKRLLSEKDALLSGNPKLKLIPIAGNGKSESRDEIPHTLYTKDHEMARRNLDNSIKELFYYLNSQFEHAKYLSFANHAINQTLSLIAQSAAFSSVDRADRWREKALASISEEMQLHLDKLQHPSDCATARALICTLNKGCGFGCQLHHVTYCFIVAYGTNRTLILHRDGKEWNYSERGWSAAFRPVSGCKHDQISKDQRDENEWSSVEANAAHRVVKLPIIDGLYGRPPFLPLAIPKHLADDLIKLHSNPPVFFISQFMRYLMRPNSSLAKRITEFAAKVSFESGPIVGLQIRRTDKVGTEAEFHALSEYMKWTEYWFRIQEYRHGKAVKRRIYVATDDPTVFSEARKKYPNYEVFGDAAISNTANTRSRYSIESLYGVIIDIEMLARCDYLVCTFSSQVCRMGYELMQIRVGDAGDNFHSLDDLYYYGGQQAHEQVVVESYQAESKDEIDLEIGDTIGIAGNHWDGFSKGTNRRNGAVGLYPSYKTREKWIIVPFP